MSLEISKQLAAEKFNDVIHEACVMYPQCEDDLCAAYLVFDLKGMSTGSAERDGTEFMVHLNPEALELNLEYILNETIPHEVAHLVNFSDRSTGSSHNSGWKEVALNLGCSARRCHNIQLTRARRVRQYEYKLEDGTTILLKKKTHNGIHSGQYHVTARADVTVSKKPVVINRNDFVGDKLV